MGMSMPACCAACQTVVPRATGTPRPSMVSVTVAGGSATERPPPQHPAPTFPLEDGVAFRPQGEEWTEILIPPPAALGGRHTRGLFRRHRLRSCGDRRGQSVLYVASPRAGAVLVLGPEVLQRRVEAGGHAFPEQAEAGPVGPVRDGG